jgi:hypothetical protein
VSTLSCDAYFSFQCVCNQTTDNYTLNITGNYTSGLMTFVVSGLTTPINATNNYFTMGSFDARGYELDYSENVIIFKTLCIMPCKNC